METNIFKIESLKSYDKRGKYLTLYFDKGTITKEDREKINKFINENPKIEIQVNIN